MKFLEKKAWSAYAVGAGIGVLSWFTFATADRPLGITTAFEYTAALAQRAIAPGLAAPYAAAQAAEGKAPAIDWEWALVLGVFLGAYASARLSGDRAPEERAPAVWRQRFGGSSARRYAAAFIGGLIMMLGARIARGCTSGHMISGILQLSLASMIFAAVAASVAEGAAFVLYGTAGRIHD